jgi:hypothetical protein
MFFVPLVQLAIVIAIMSAAMTAAAILIVAICLLFVSVAMAMTVVIIMAMLREHSIRPKAQQKCCAGKVEKSLPQHRFSFEIVRSFRL